MFATLVYLISPMLAALGGLFLARALPIKPRVRAAAGVFGIFLGLLVEAWTLAALSVSPTFGCGLLDYFWPAFYVSSVSSGFAISAFKGTRTALAIPALAAAVVLVGAFAIAGILNGAAASIARCN